MAIKTKSGKYKCGYCGKQYSTISEAGNCKESHKLIYVAFTKEDLNNLIQFIFSKNEELLGEDLVGRLQSYLRGRFYLDTSRRDDEGSDSL